MHGKIRPSGDPDIRKGDMNFSRTLLASTLAATGIVAGLAAPAQAAYPTSSYYVGPGNTYTYGTLTWYNRSVGYDGTNLAQEGQCRQTRFRTFTSGGSQLGSTTAGFVCTAVGNGKRANSYGGGVAADVAGGAAYVEVCLMGSSFPSSEPMTVLTCTNYYRP
ncbi:hypothetical protein ACPSM1_13690 [Micromonospora chersina]|uniref:hypothetical protein n=1 Tax=Micromonospora chersina TaxID=47854 RepID=UPI003CA32DFC